MLPLNRKTIGIFGGSFDPPHKGHVEISKISLKKIKLKKIYWIITKKNPFKKKTTLDLKERIKLSKKVTKFKKFIKIRYYENKIKSNRTINLINYIKKKENCNVFLIIGADNLINFHNWYKWRSISQKCNILVFDRLSYKSKSLKSIAFKRLKQKNLKFVNFKKVNISSSKLRKI